jgi:SAM-dependent methyltransferase
MADSCAPLSRREKILVAIDPRTLEGAEIGPLASPIVRRSEGPIRYADHSSTAALRAKYQDHGWDTAEIVDVDVDLSGRTTSEALGASSVDYLLASHVIEHVPDPAGWLQDLHRALRPQGLVSLVIPDKRYCFDVRRPESTTGELVDALLSRRTNPTLKQVYDFWALYCAVDSAAVWSGAVDPAALPLSGTKQNALERCRHVQGSSGYADVHCWVFTPESFLQRMGDLVELGLLPYRLEAFFPTPFGDLEFFITLRRIEPQAEPAAECEARANRFRAEALATAERAPVVQRNTRGSPRPLSSAQFLHPGLPFYRALKNLCSALAHRLRAALGV